MYYLFKPLYKTLEVLLVLLACLWTVLHEKGVRDVHRRVTFLVRSKCSAPPEAALMTLPAMGTTLPMACTIGSTVWATLALREVDGPETALSTHEWMGAEVLPRSHGD